MAACSFDPAMFLERLEHKKFEFDVASSLFQLTEECYAENPDMEKVTSMAEELTTCSTTGLSGFRDWRHLIPMKYTVYSPGRFEIICGHLGYTDDQIEGFERTHANDFPLFHFTLDK